MNGSAQVDRRKLQGIYARLRGMNAAMPLTSTARGTIGEDLDLLIRQVGEITGEDVSTFILPRDTFYRGATSAIFCHVEVVKSRLGQMLAYLEQVYFINTTIVEIGSLYNSIKDDELKQRCSDLLSAPGNFDRVINQATLVLEDRIRTKSKMDKPLVGVPLVNSAMNPDPSKALIVISSTPEEHEGISYICRGLAQAFRNVTHHHLTDQYTREDALKVCAFIDQLLGVIGQARLNESASLR